MFCSVLLIVLAEKIVSISTAFDTIVVDIIISGVRIILSFNAFASLVSEQIDAYQMK
jgi:hypothetical protein